MRKCKVALGDDLEFDAIVRDGDVWNGWSVPFLTTESWEIIRVNGGWDAPNCTDYSVTVDGVTYYQSEDGFTWSVLD